MNLFKSGNPTLKERVFEGQVIENSDFVMTERGTMNKFLFLFLMVMGSASFTWTAYAQGAEIGPWLIGSIIAGFVTVLIISFRPQTAPYLSPAYALIEGVFLGGVSAVYNNAFAKVAPGIVMQAVVLTFAVVLAMYALYRFNIIRATEKFRSIIITATVGIAIFYLIAFIMQLCGLEIAFLHEGSPLGIIFSLVITGIAALNLILDFDMIERGVAARAPKFMEWYAAFGLLVTIVWLYIEILRLLAKFNRK